MEDGISKTQERDSALTVGSHRHDLSALVELYGILFTKFNQEGDGIWNRFNIMFAISVAIFGGVVYVYFANPRPTLWRQISVGLSTGGLLSTIWSIYVLGRLRLWHQHWRNMLKEIEQAFPEREGWVKPHWQLPPSLKRDPKMAGRWPPPYTQVFFYILAIAWVTLLVLLLTRTL